MKISYFPEYTAKNAQPVLKSFLRGCYSAGHTFVQNDMDADAVVIWSVLWQGTMAPNRRIYQHYQHLNRPVIVVDIGTLNRGVTWKIAVNNINASGVYAHTENLDWDRPAKLNVSLSTNLSSNPRIVVAGQHCNSQQVAELTSVEDWISAQIINIKQISDRPIVVRPHPRSKLDFSKLPHKVHIERPVKLANTYDSYNNSFDCHALVNYNSGPGILAALGGIRPLVDSTSLAHPVAIQLPDLDKPYNIDRDQWLVEICHTEYTLEEIEAGSWITRLTPHL